MTTTDWTPLLDGAERSRALRIARDIAEALRTEAHPDIGASLAGGKAGLALLFGYLDQVLPEQGYDELAGDSLETAFAALGDLGSSPSLYSGALGLGFAIEHLSSMFEQDDSGNPLDDLDSWAVSLLERPMAALPEYDLVSGWVGMGVYALERLPRPRAREMLERVVERLFDIAEHQDGGLAWRHPAPLLPAWQRAEYPNGWYNLGMAHGMPGIVALLGECIRAGVASARSDEILRGLVPWMSKQRLPGTGGFPAAVAPGAKPTPARSAWCYGDPGVAIALLGAAGAAGNEEWQRSAVEIAHGIATRPHARQGVVDAMLCHGATGLAHVLNRFFQATREPILADAARRWFNGAFAMQKPGSGVAGYSSFEPGTPGDLGRADRWEATPGLLTGAAGVALALLAASSSVEPRWDRMLLARVPPSPA